MTRVGVFGAAGKMGTAVCRAVHEADGLELVAAVDPFAAGRSVGELVPGIDLVITESPQALLDAGAEVVVDFTVLEAARANLDWCAANGVHAVVGTTGFSADDLARYEAAFTASSAMTNVPIEVSMVAV
jgi:4-hydroxy-tetrahydrodipicolinate reductase